MKSFLEINEIFHFIRGNPHMNSFLEINEIFHFKSGNPPMNSFMKIFHFIRGNPHMNSFMKIFFHFIQGNPHMNSFMKMWKFVLLWEETFHEQVHENMKFFSCYWKKSFSTFPYMYETIGNFLGPCVSSWLKGTVSQDGGWGKALEW
jgi:hypothetical protein